MRAPRRHHGGSFDINDHKNGFHEQVAARLRAGQCVHAGVFTYFLQVFIVKLIKTIILVNVHPEKHLENDESVTAYFY